MTRKRKNEVGPGTSKPSKAVEQRSEEKARSEEDHDSSKATPEEDDRSLPDRPVLWKELKEILHNIFFINDFTKHTDQETKKQLLDLILERAATPTASAPKWTPRDGSPQRTKESEEQKVKDKENKSKDKEQTTKDKEQKSKAKQNKNKYKKDDLKNNEQKLNNKEKEHKAKEKKLNAKEQELKEKEQELKDKEQELKDKAQELKNKELQPKDKEQEVKDQEQDTTNNKAPERQRGTKRSSDLSERDLSAKLARIRDTDVLPLSNSQPKQEEANQNIPNNESMGQTIDNDIEPGEITDNTSKGTKRNNVRSDGTNRYNQENRRFIINRSLDLKILKEKSVLSKWLFKPMCKYYRDCKYKSTCKYEHRLPEVTDLKSSLKRLNVDAIVDEYNFIHKTYSSSGYTYVMCFVDEFISRNETRIVVEIAIDITKERKLKPSSRCTHDVLQATLLQLDKTPLDVCADLFFYDLNNSYNFPRFLLVEKLMLTIIESRPENFAKYLSIFRKLARFSLDNEIELDIKITRGLLDNIANSLELFSKSFVELAVEMFLRDRRILQDQSVSVFKEKLKGLHEDLFKDFQTVCKYS